MARAEHVSGVILVPFRNDDRLLEPLIRLGTAVEAIDRRPRSLPVDRGLVDNTTVVQPAYELGYRAADLLLERLQKGGGSPAELALPPALVVRGSSLRRPRERLSTLADQRLSRASSFMAMEMVEGSGA